MGTARSKEHLLQLAKSFQEKLEESKPQITINLDSYRGGRYEVEYHCSEHDFTGVALGCVLLKSLGCPSCQYEKHVYKTPEYREYRRKSEAEKFITKAKLVHGDKYQYNADWYASADDALTKIWCNRHQSFFFQRPAAHLQGQGCPDCGKESNSINSRHSDEMFHNKWQAVNTNPLLSYVKGTFEQYHSKIKIQCEIHGVFEITANNSLNKSCCSLCNKETRRLESIASFIENGTRLHDGNYEYVDVEKHYVTNRSKIPVRCKIHDHVFLTSMNKHIDSKSGCPLCAKEKFGRWSLKCLDKNKEFYQQQECSVYLMKFKSSDEEFYKIGFSIDMKIRVSLFLRELPDFTIEVLKTNTTNTYDSLTKEKEFQKRLKKFKYLPKIKFGGYTECFKLDENTLEEVMSWFY